MAVVDVLSVSSLGESMQLRIYGTQRTNEPIDTLPYDANEAKGDIEKHHRCQTNVMAGAIVPEAGSDRLNQCICSM